MVVNEGEVKPDEALDGSQAVMGMGQFLLHGLDIAVHQVREDVDEHAILGFEVMKDGALGDPGDPGKLGGRRRLVAFGGE
jgi:hypothetical protein